MFEGLKRYKMKETLMKGKFELISIKGNPLSLIALPNGNLVCGTDISVILLNENFHEIKIISTGGLSFCALNRKSEICLSLYKQDCIMLFDLNLNKLKEFGSYGSENNQLKCPLGLCCDDNYLYICDRSNKRIQILTLNFQFVKTIQLDNNAPYRIQVSETTLGVSCDQATLFYDTETGAIKYRYFYGTYNINYIDSKFYASNHSKKKFYTFDSDGKFIEDLTINDNLSKHLTNWHSGSLCKYKENLYIADYYSSQLLKFIQ